MVGDVVGHGAASALITGTVRGAQTILQAWIERDPTVARDPREITRFFNRTVFEAARGALSMTFFAAILDIEAETLVCSNAGHNLPYLLVPPADGGEPQLKVVGRSGIPLGHAIDTEYTETVSYPWSPGSQLVLYTDGLTEVLRGTEFLWDRKALKRGLKKFGNERGKDLLRHLLHDRKESIQDAIEEDDVTVVICEARAPERPAERRKPLSSGTAEPLAPVAEPAFPEAVVPVDEPPPAEPARPAEEPPLPELVEPVTEPKNEEEAPA
jgi:sigma-B regulation protein RsbU (phosphoserine phosphatase)